jgi:hypothetical protein
MMGQVLRYKSFAEEVSALALKQQTDEGMQKQLPKMLDCSLLMVADVGLPENLVGRLIGSGGWHIQQFIEAFALEGAYIQDTGAIRSVSLRSADMLTLLDARMWLNKFVRSGGHCTLPGSSHTGPTEPGCPGQASGVNQGASDSEEDTWGDWTPEGKVTGGTEFINAGGQCPLLRSRPTAQMKRKHPGQASGTNPGASDSDEDAWGDWTVQGKVTKICQTQEQFSRV